jgi:hypothetical protein
MNCVAAPSKLAEDEDILGATNAKEPDLSANSSCCNIQTTFQRLSCSTMPTGPRRTQSLGLKINLAR